MFEQLEQLRRERNELLEVVAKKDAEIAQALDAIENRVCEYRNDIAPHGRSARGRAFVFDPTKNADGRRRQSDAMKAHWARKKANGESWSAYHNKSVETADGKHA